MFDFKKNDCIFFIGEKPCKYKQQCPCKYYRKQGKRILIIKLGALGDVLRTTPLLWGLKRKYKNTFITWLTDKEALPLLEENPLIDRIFSWNFENILSLFCEKFDLLICLEKMPKATNLLNLISASKKIGFSSNEFGNLYPINSKSEYAFRLGLDDDLKFRKNKKTYQEIIFEMCGLNYKNDEYILELTDEDRNYAKEFYLKNKVKKDDILIGFNTGAGEMFANKIWTVDKFVKLAEKIYKNLNAKIILLGGKEELDKNKEIQRKLRIKILNSNLQPLRKFAAIIERCNLILTGDTLGMHIAIALKKKIVVLFGSTCYQEIELYNRGKKIISRIDCSPCYKKICEIKDNCMEKISVEEVFKTIKGII